MKKMCLFIILFGQSAYGMKRSLSEDVNKYPIIKSVQYELNAEVVSVNGTGSNTKVIKFTISGSQLFSLENTFENTLINQNHSPRNVSNDVQKVIRLLYKKYVPQDKQDTE